MNEPLMKRRDVKNDVKTGDSSLPRDKSRSYLITGLGGVRRTGGMNSSQGLVRNVGTCPLTSERKMQDIGYIKNESIEVIGRDGVSRSSDEALETWWSEGGTLHSQANGANCYTGGAL